MTDVESLDVAPAEAEHDIAHRLDPTAPLARRTAHGVAWVAGARLGAQVVQFAASIVLARLLLPSAYGLVAIVWVFTGFAGMLTDLGLGASLVQSDRVTEADASTAFWINAMTGVALTGITFALRVPLAALFGQPRLAGLLGLAGLGFTIAVTTVPTALLERRMQFSRVAAIDIGTTTFGFFVTIACAATGVGAESLVIGPLASMALASITSFAACGWLPHARPRRDSAHRLVSFGSHLTGFNLIAYWARNADNLLLGRFAGTTELGLYNRAYMLMMMPITQVSGVLGRVLLPVFATLQHDQERLRRAVLRVCHTSGVLVFPILFGLAGLAHNFVMVAFGERWRGTIPLLITLAIAGAPAVAGSLAGLICQAVGQPRLLSTWGNLSSLSVIAAILIGLPWGAEGVAVALAVRAYLFLPLAMAPARHAIGVGAAAVVRACGLPFFCATVMGGCVALIGWALGAQVPGAVALGIQLLTGVVVYGLFISCLDHRALLDVRALLASRPL